MLFDDLLAATLSRRCFGLCTGPRHSWPKKLAAHRPLHYCGDKSPFCTAVQVVPREHTDPAGGWITPQNTPRSTRPTHPEQPTHAVRTNPDAAAHVWTVSAQHTADSDALLVVLDVV